MNRQYVAVIGPYPGWLVFVNKFPDRSFNHIRSTVTLGDMVFQWVHRPLQSEGLIWSGMIQLPGALPRLINEILTRLRTQPAL